MATAVTPDVVGTAGAAEICGVEVQRISRWKAKGKMPEPAAETTSGPVYWRTDIVALSKGRPAATPPEKLSVLSLGDVQVYLGLLLKRPKLSKTQIGRWRDQGHFPEPCIELSAGKTVYPLWWAKDVDEFAAHDRGRDVSDRERQRAWKAAEAARAAKGQRRNGNG